MHDRKLLAGLSKCAWKILGRYLKHPVPYDEAVAGGVVAVQTFGDFQNFNPHLHIIATDGCFYEQGRFQKANQPSPRPFGRATIPAAKIWPGTLSGRPFFYRSV